MTFLCVCLPLSHSQTSQGVQPKRFKTLPELVSLYLQPSQGLVTTLLYAVDREETVVTDDRDYSGNKLTPQPHSGRFLFPFVSDYDSFFVLTCRWRGWEASPPPSLCLHLHSPWTRNTDRKVQSLCYGSFNRILLTIMKRPAKRHKHSHISNAHTESLLFPIHLIRVK